MRKRDVGREKFGEKGVMCWGILPWVFLLIRLLFLVKMLSTSRVVHVRDACGVERWCVF